MTVCGNVTLGLQSFKSCILWNYNFDMNHQVASGNNVTVSYIGISRQISAMP